jgi:hypothetical protein
MFASDKHALEDLQRLLPNHGIVTASECIVFRQEDKLFFWVP